MTEPQTRDEMRAEWAAQEAKNMAISRDEFIRRFKQRMIDAAGPTFDDGTSIADYAEKEAGPSYYADIESRRLGPEESADADMSYWGE